MQNQYALTSLTCLMIYRWYFSYRPKLIRNVRDASRSVHVRKDAQRRKVSIVRVVQSAVACFNWQGGYEETGVHSRPEKRDRSVIGDEPAPDNGLAPKMRRSFDARDGSTASVPSSRSPFIIRKLIPRAHGKHDSTFSRFSSPLQHF